MAEVAMTRTPLGERTAAELFCESYRDRYGELPDPRVAAFALAVTWIETGQGQSIYNHNLGNLIATSPTQPHWVPPWVDDPNHRLHGKPGVPTMFRAFDSFDEGVRRQWSTLKGPRYQNALAIAATGDFFSAYRNLVESGYCPDPECHSDAAANNVKSFAEGFLSSRLFENVCGASIPASAPELGSRPRRRFFDNPVGALMTMAWLGTGAGLAWRAYA